MASAQPFSLLSETALGPRRLDRPAVVFVVDDDASMREALGSLIRSAGLSVETFSSAEEFLDSPRLGAPSCLVLDVCLPGLSGLDLQGRMAEVSIQMPIIFISGHGDVLASVRAMKGGARDFLLKPFEEADLLKAIELAISEDRMAREQQVEMAELRACYESLTPREREVMERVVGGLLNKQISADLGLSEITVKVHRGHVMHKMNAESLADLVRKSGKLGIPQG